ncbi:MAG: penicillin-binding protein 2 [Candidatus Omnitrophota bacterium]
MRPLIFRVSIYAGLVGLGLGLFQTQVIDGSQYRRLSEKNRIRLIPLEAPRGRVFDSKGKLLATNRPSYDIMATPEDMGPETVPKLSRLLKLPENEIHKRMRYAREYPFTPAMIQEDVTKETAFAVEEHRTELPGVFVNLSSIRYYPYGQTASHLIGYIGKIGPAEYANLDRQRYGLNSLVGRAGLEKVYDETLRGWRGGRQIEVNARGEMIRVLSDRDPEPGEDLHLTVDLEFQAKITGLLKDKHAAVAVMDLRTNGLLALVSSPTFDPNAFVSPSRSSERMALLADKNYPMLNRAVGSAYPPGSVFKVVTALSALERGKITAQSSFTCTGRFRLTPGGRPYACWYKQGHGTLGLYEAIERSCNVYFYHLGSLLQPEDIAHYARELGLGQTVRLELPDTNPGLVPDAGWKQARFRQKWYQGETLSYAIGQSYLLTSPIQILRLVSIIAQDGKWVDPHLVASRETHTPAVPARYVAIHPENMKIIKRGMLQVVQSQFGTGQLAKVDFAKLAAKTGTAQVPPGIAHAWMTGFFPYEDPQIAFVVFVEHGGSGGIAAGHIVKDMLQIWKDYA